MGSFFICLCSRGDPSCSAVELCSTDSSTADRLWSTSRGHRSMKWKKKTNPSVGAAQHLIQLIKWLIRPLKVVSGPDNAALWGREKKKSSRTRICLDLKTKHSWKIILVLAAQVYTVDNGGGLWVMNWKAFNWSKVGLYLISGLTNRWHYH